VFEEWFVVAIAGENHGGVCADLRDEPLGERLYVKDEGAVLVEVDVAHVGAVVGHFAEVLERTSVVGGNRAWEGFVLLVVEILVQFHAE